MCHANCALKTTNPNSEHKLLKNIYKNIENIKYNQGMKSKKLSFGKYIINERHIKLHF